MLECQCILEEQESTCKPKTNKKNRHITPYHKSKMQDNYKKTKKNWTKYEKQNGQQASHIPSLQGVLNFLRFNLGSMQAYSQACLPILIFLAR
jgi:hypothetical protein